MRYIGRDDTSIYLKCGHCKKIHTCSPLEYETEKKGICPYCQKNFHFIFFYPFKLRSFTAWLPAMLMTLFFILVVFCLSFPPLLQQYQFNRFVTTSNSLIISTFVPILGSVLSFVLSLPGLKDSETSRLNLSKALPLLLLLAEGIALIFVMNNIIETHYCSHIIVDSNTGEEQQYFGSVTGEYASGKGRLFDSQGNLIYFGEFKSDLYDGYGKKYELINTVNNTDYTQSYQCIYEGYFKDGLYNGKGREYRYDAEYTFEKNPEEFPYLYYDGEFIQGKYCGNGILYNTTEKYIGSFFDGKYNGYGTRWVLNSSSSKVYQYEGYYRDGKMDGPGKKYYPNGQILHDGIYENNKSTSGTTYYEDGSIMYKGEYSDSSYNGKGILYWQNGNVKYDGEWSNGKRHGNGTYFREDGTKLYDGGWKEDKYYGYGKSFYEDGITTQYAGRWKDGVRSGEGKEYYANGVLRYDGSWEDDKWNGYGTWYWESGNKYCEGIFKNGVLNGEATKYHENGELKYKGSFKDDVLNGYGIQYYINGNLQYEGNFKDGQWNGQGKWYWENGNLYYEGNFENGTPEGIGTTYTDEKILTYKGSFSNGNRNGQGTSYWPNGNIQYSGEFLDGEFLTGTEYSEDGELLYEIE